MVSQEIFIIIEKGEPYETGTKIPLQKGSFLIGRAWEMIQPDISFTSLYISKKHAIIELTNEKITITDLDSKHGTEVNGFNIGCNIKNNLENGDKINLAKGTVILTYKNLREKYSGETIDFNGKNMSMEQKSNKLLINIDRREITIEGKRVSISGKDLDLLLLLYEQRNKAISYDIIKARVWPERLSSGFVDVGNDEINVLVYRLRKRLKEYGKLIVAIPRYGYMLDLS